MPGKRLLLDTNAIIAGTALHHECLIVTADAHFGKIKEPWHVLCYTPIALI